MPTATPKSSLPKPNILRPAINVVIAFTKSAAARMRIALRVMKEKARYEIPSRLYSRGGLLTQAVVIIVGYAFFRFYPHTLVGVWIAILGFIAVIVAVRAEHLTHGEKIVWVIVTFVILTAEVRGIYHDRDEHDAAQRIYDEQQREIRDAQNKEFQNIASGLATVVKQSQEQFSQMMSGISDAMKMQTGGDSFAFITFTIEPGYVQISDFPHPATPYFLVSIASRGKYPLRDVRAWVMDDERRLEAMNEYNKHPSGDWMTAIQSADTLYQYPYLRPQSPEAPTGDVQPLGTYPVPKGTSKRISINFASLNGYWNEVLHLGLVNGGWHQCLSLAGPTAKQMKTPFIYCDTTWPEGKALSEKDWVFTKPALSKGK